MTRRFVQEELNSQAVKLREENRFHQFAARQYSYHLNVYNLVYRIVDILWSSGECGSLAFERRNRFHRSHLISLTSRGCHTGTRSVSLLS